MGPLDIITAQIKNNRVTHAYLFYGINEEEIHRAALHFALFLNCSHLEKDEPCLKCRNCRKIAAGLHPDVEVIKPEANSLKINQIRALQERLSYCGYEGQYKVIIIYKAHLMTLAAANSLLKILEEPPDRTVFILISEDANLLPATIRSRCQLFYFNTQNAALQKTELMRAKIDSINEMSRFELLDWADEWAKNRDDLGGGLEMLTVFYRDKMVWLLTGKKDLLLAEGEEVIKNGKTVKGCLEALGEINKTIGYLKGNGNVRLIMEVFLINLRSIEERHKGKGRAL